MTTQEERPLEGGQAIGGDTHEWDPCSYEEGPGELSFPFYHTRTQVEGAIHEPENESNTRHQINC